MVTSYKKLWKLLIDKDMKKVDLRKEAHLSSSTIAKLTKGENVSTAVLVECNVNDIMDIVSEED